MHMCSFVYVMRSTGDNSEIWTQEKLSCSIQSRLGGSTKMCVISAINTLGIEGRNWVKNVVKI